MAGRSLQWWKTPSRLLPHGVLGVIAVSLGFYLAACALLGQLAAYRDRQLRLLTSYQVFAAANALAGGWMSRRAPSAELRLVFRFVTMLELSLLYYSARFAGSLDSIVGSWADKMAAVLFLGGFVVLAGVMWKDWRVYPAIGSLMPLVFYPLQLAIFPEDWLSCVQRVYPDQGLALSAFVYTPTSAVVAALAFGATLHMRGYVSRALLAVVAALLGLGTLASMVIMQEVHLLGVTTQKLLILCPEEAAPANWRAASQALDLTPMARQVAAACGLIAAEDIHRGYGGRGAEL
eukprot:TRINITY_DN19276_c0_g2_i2.p1 TRINITY_DN19276_c0_g2~~TRINITY_DN19276_c0_g2_i2.p1  ORF type:complete len:309 (-),score=45.48 TRINITY_DN19276_c0_g2_i2:728-1600(-)